LTEPGYSATFRQLSAKGHSTDAEAGKQGWRAVRGSLCGAMNVPRRRNLAEQVFGTLQRAIKSGAYAADERLPTEHDLAAEFAVSRPVIREALRRLRSHGLIYSRRGAGSFVRQVGVREPLGFGPVASIADLDRCYEFRLILEPAAAAAAALGRTDAAMTEIRAALDTMRIATARQRHREDADFAFHVSIARASGNRYIATAMESLEDHIAVAMQFHGQALRQRPDALADVYTEHVAIHDAIREGRAEEAQALMQSHLSESRARLFSGAGAARSGPEDPGAE